MARMGISRWTWERALRGLALSLAWSAAWPGEVSAQARELATPFAAPRVPDTASGGEFDDSSPPSPEPSVGAAEPPEAAPASLGRGPPQAAPRPGRVRADPRVEIPVGPAPSSFPPPPGEGLVPIWFEADPARRFAVTRLLATAHGTARHGLDFETIEVHASSYGLVCLAPCASWLVPGAYRFGVGRDERPRWRTRIVQVDGPTTLSIDYIDHGVLRGVGVGIFLASLATGVLVTFDLLDGGDAILPLVAAGAGAIGIFVSLGLLCAGDGVEFYLRPGMPRS